MRGLGTKKIQNFDFTRFSDQRIHTCIISGASEWFTRIHNPHRPPACPTGSGGHLVVFLDELHPSPQNKDTEAEVPTETDKQF